MKKILKMSENRLKKHKTREEFFVRKKNVSRPHQQKTTSSVKGTDDDLIEVQVEETVLIDHAEHRLAAEETNIEEWTPENVQNEVPNVGTSEDSGKIVSPASGEERCKSFGNSAQVRKNPF